MTRANRWATIDGVEVVEADHLDDGLVVTLPGNSDDIAPLTFELSRDEARDLIAGLAALL